MTEPPRRRGRPRRRYRADRDLPPVQKLPAGVGLVRVVPGRPGQAVAVPGLHHGGLDGVGGPQPGEGAGLPAPVARPPRVPATPPSCPTDHQIVWVSARRWTCATYREARKRQRGRELWQRVKAEAARLAAKRRADRESKRRRAERERALRPPKPSRRQPDGTWPASPATRPRCRARSTPGRPPACPRAAASSAFGPSGGSCGPPASARGRREGSPILGQASELVCDQSRTESDAPGGGRVGPVSSPVWSTATRSPWHG